MLGTGDTTVNRTGVEVPALAEPVALLSFAWNQKCVHLQMSRPVPNCSVTEPHSGPFKSSSALASFYRDLISTDTKLPLPRVQ